MGAQAVTIAPELVTQGLAMPAIQKAVTDFQEDWVAVFGVETGKRISIKRTRRKKRPFFFSFFFCFSMKHLPLFTCLKIRQFSLFVKEFLKKKGYLLGIFFGSSMMRVSNDRRKRE